MEEKNNYRIKIDGNEFEELSMSPTKSEPRIPISLMVTKRMLRRMKKFSEIQNNVSNDTIVYAYIKDTLNLIRD